jgi:ABC-type transport system involved in multi-copper enzyme maturation permease subunit
MTTATMTPGRVARSEWIKLRTVRSNVWALAGSAAVIAGTGLLLSAITRGHLAATSGQPHIDAVRISLFGMYLAQLTIGVLGALLATGEYATGMIRATLSAVPRRLLVLWAKLAVFAVVVLATCELTLFLTFLAAQALLSSGHAGVSLAAPGVLRAVAGTGLYLTLVGMLGIALGFTVRNTAATAAIMFSVVLVVPEVLGAALPADWAGRILPYLPSTAGQAIMLVRHIPGNLAPWPGLALFAGYTAAAIALAALLLKRRDA